MRIQLSFLLMAGIACGIYAEDVRIACIGNSITSGAGNPKTNLDAYPAQLRLFFGEGYDIQNFGVSGTTMLKNGDVPYWNEPAFSEALAFQPDIITIMLGTNDSKPQNWVYREEYLPDYRSMIDTFMTLASNPKIYVCLPPPAFSSKYDITDSVIVNDMIPMIRQLAAEKNLGIIDFYTEFLDKPNLFYDGIHPTKDGLFEFAKWIYQNLDEGGDITVVQLKDTNLAANKSVQTGGAYDNTGRLVDDNIHTYKPVISELPLTIDLGTAASVDMVQILFREASDCGYIVETGSDGNAWTMAADSSRDKQVRQVNLNPIAPSEIRYVRITFLVMAAGLPQVDVSEIRVLETAPVHAPVISYEFLGATSVLAKFDLTVTSSTQKGAIRYSYDSLPDGKFEGGIGYRPASVYTVMQSVRADGDRYIFAKCYKDGYEALTDTLRFEYTVLTTGIEDRKQNLPSAFMLHPNCPNPFNPATTISYELAKSSHVRLTITNTLGQTVDNLISEVQPAGLHQIVYRPGHLPSGSYFYTLDIEGYCKTGKMILQK